MELVILVLVLIKVRAGIKNLFMLSVRISSYGCTREVWRARKMRKSCNSSFLSALQTSQVMCENVASARRVKKSWSMVWIC